MTAPIKIRGIAALDVANFLKRESDSGSGCTGAEVFLDLLFGEAEREVFAVFVRAVLFEELFFELPEADFTECDFAVFAIISRCSLSP